MNQGCEPLSTQSMHFPAPQMTPALVAFLLLRIPPLTLFARDWEPFQSFALSHFGFLCYRN